jgi:uncharacterized membrane-anchored protein YjiN (DUF445 family)
MNIQFDKVEFKDLKIVLKESIIAAINNFKTEKKSGFILISLNKNKDGLFKAILTYTHELIDAKTKNYILLFSKGDVGSLECLDASFEDSIVYYNQLNDSSLQILEDGYRVELHNLNKKKDFQRLLLEIQLATLRNYKENIEVLKQ